MEPFALESSEAWRHLSALGRSRSLADLFADDPDRARRYTFEAGDLRVDISRQQIDGDVLDAFIDVLTDARVTERRDELFGGLPVNTSEARSVLHPALRASVHPELMVDGVAVDAAVRGELHRLRTFATEVRADPHWREIVNIGIGGSDLGPAMAARALADFVAPGLRLHFVSNVDGADLEAVLAHCDPAQTLFIVVSKTFTTVETMANADTARRWIVEALGEAAVDRHFVAVSSDLDAVSAFGISRAFGIWDWVGGRFSLPSAVGLSLMIGIGPDRFDELLEGYRIIDEHFVHAPPERNVPMLMAMLSVWNSTVLGRATRAVIPYAAGLARLPAFLQQLEMESNGKSVRGDGTAVVTTTGPIIWGEPGTNGQHAFFQLLHQGTTIVPVDFIGFARAGHRHPRHHDLLMANLFAQARALAFGRSGSTQEPAPPERRFDGDRPSTLILAERLTPSTLGQIIALYEHGVLVQGIIWGINSFDQWGVELGKEIATSILADIEAPDFEGGYDSATDRSIEWYRRYR